MNSLNVGKLKTPTFFKNRVFLLFFLFKLYPVFSYFILFKVFSWFQNKYLTFKQVFGVLHKSIVPNTILFAVNFFLYFAHSFSISSAWTKVFRHSKEDMVFKSAAPEYLLTRWSFAANYLYIFFNSKMTCLFRLQHQIFFAWNFLTLFLRKLWTLQNWTNVHKWHSTLPTQKKGTHM